MVPKLTAAAKTAARASCSYINFLKLFWRNFDFSSTIILFAIVWLSYRED